MKVGDQAEIRDLEGKWIPCEVMFLQADGTFGVRVHSRGHLWDEADLICDSRNIREKPLDSKSGSVLNDAPNGHTYHS